VDIYFVYLGIEIYINTPMRGVDICRKFGIIAIIINITTIVIKIEPYK